MNIMYYTKNKKEGNNAFPLAHRMLGKTYTPIGTKGEFITNAKR